MAFLTVLLILAIIVCLYMAWNIGANDVANAMGTSVGSGALTFKQAVIVAAIFEFAGAVLVGGHVTDTVRKGIVPPETFMEMDVQILFVYGMVCAALASAIWLHLATYLGWPVSTTHSIVGAVAGFGFLIGGVSAVKWSLLGTIALSWIISPLCGGFLGYIVYVLIRKKIRHSTDQFSALKKLAPLLLAVVWAVLVLSVIYKGLKNLHLDLPFWKAGIIALGIGGFSIFISRYWIDSIGNSMVNATEKVDPVNKVFKTMQIITACLIAFAHGSNDVANSIGPLAAVVDFYSTQTIKPQVGVPMWILLLGGVGIVVGLATYGYKVISTIGENITELTPTRGFSAEFGAATTILLGSKLGLPISTTHTLVGAVIGVGLARGMNALNLNVVKKIASSWVITIPFTAFLTVVLYKIMVWVSM